MKFKRIDKFNEYLKGWRSYLDIRNYDDLKNDNVCVTKESENNLDFISESHSGGVFTLVYVSANEFDDGISVDWLPLGSDETDFICKRLGR